MTNKSKNAIVQLFIVISSLIFILLDSMFEMYLNNKILDRNYEFVSSSLSYLLLVLPNSFYILMPSEININVRYIILFVFSLIFSQIYIFLQGKYNINRAFMFFLYIITGAVWLQAAIYLRFLRILGTQD